MGRIVGRKRTTLKGKQQQAGSADGTQQPGPETVHRRNVHLFAQPVILAFHVVRFVAFQLWLLLSLVCRVGSHVLATRTQASSETAVQTVVEQQTRRASSSSTSSVVEMVRPGTGSPGRGPPGGAGGGFAVRPGAPVLAQQKHHHRKAFEYISKALKLDEDGKGSTSLLSFCLLVVTCQRHCCKSTLTKFGEGVSSNLHFRQKPMGNAVVKRYFSRQLHAKWWKMGDERNAKCV